MLSSCSTTAAATARAATMRAQQRRHVYSRRCTQHPHLKRGRGRARRRCGCPRCTRRLTSSVGVGVGASPLRLSSVGVGASPLRLSTLHAASHLERGRGRGRVTAAAVERGRGRVAAAGCTRGLDLRGLDLERGRGCAVGVSPTGVWQRRHVHTRAAAALKGEGGVASSADGYVACRQLRGVRQRLEHVRHRAAAALEGEGGVASSADGSVACQRLCGNVWSCEGGVCNERLDYPRSCRSMGAVATLVPTTPRWRVAVTLVISTGSAIMGS